MPRERPRDGSTDAGFGIFRGRFGTTPAAHPQGSLVYSFPTRWNHTYAVREDLIVHEKGTADRLAFRGLSEQGRFGFSASGRWLAANAEDRVVAVDLRAWDRDPRASLEAIEIAADCSPDALRWAPQSELLVMACGDDTLRVWDATIGKKASVDVEEIAAVLGWWSGPVGRRLTGLPEPDGDVAEVVRYRVGRPVGAHTGPGTAGLFVFRRPSAR